MPAISIVRWLTVCLVIAALAGCAGGQLSLKADLERFRALESHDVETERAYAGRILDWYQQRFAPRMAEDRLAQRGEAELLLLFEAGHNAAFYTARFGHDAPVDDLKRVLAGLQQRHAATGQNYRDGYSIYVGARRFEDARALYAEHFVVGMEPLPAIVVRANGAGGPEILNVDPQLDQLSLGQINVGAGSRIVVVSHPSCHFSHNAFFAIRKHPQLAELFRQHALWLSPANGEFEFGKLQEWNRRYPESATVIAYKQEQWEMIDQWSTPNFYFLVDGKVKAQVTGWPAEGHIDELLLAAGESGLIQPKP